MSDQPIAVPDGAMSTPPEVIVEKAEEYAYGFIIEVLTRGLYPDKLHVIREYVQNAYDAILELRRQDADSADSRIEIRVEHPSIFIYDDGIGMDSHRIAEYRYVGHSRKLTRESVGFRGIGKLSGISAAEKIIVTTSPRGLPERHQLVFDAQAMLRRVEALKASGQNISLNQLIAESTTLATYVEDPGAHYTQVELYNVRSDSQGLMDEDGLAEYLSLTAPVDFDPNFVYGTELDEFLRTHVADYDTVPLYVNEKQIFKPFLSDIRPPQYIFVSGEEAGDQSENVDENGASPPLAVSWYCEHSDKGQFEDKLRRGLLYRVKNFTIGDNQLPRITLWNRAPERSFYFVGEIHVCDQEIIPTADRTNFEQNDARERLYAQSNRAISYPLNQIAGKSSDTRRATEFISAAEDTVAQVGADIEAGRLPAELRVPTIVEVSKAVENVEKRRKNAPTEYLPRADQVIAEGRNIIGRLDPGAEKEGRPSTIYDIRDELGLGGEARWVYQSIINILREEFSSKPDVFQRLITLIHEQLLTKRE